MRRTALFLLLALGGTAHAALPRVVLETPLAPTAAPAASVLAGVPAFASPAFSAPALSARPLAETPAAAAAPAAVRPSAVPTAAPALPALAIPSSDRPLATAVPGAAEPAGPRAIDALRANAPLAAKLDGGALEESASALETNFRAAASLDPDAVAPRGALPPSGGASAHEGLLARLLERVRLDDGGDPTRGAALKRAFARMLESPTARSLAEQFLAENVPAVARFETFAGSRIYEANGRRIFYAPRAFTEWKDGTVEVRVNLDYLGTDPAFLSEDLPPTIAHELFGHGLWYSRAAKAGALQAFHHHELNETHARLVGWTVDYELDGRFEENGAWSYLQDPGHFLRALKLRLPYYALTFSNSELAQPVAALEDRLAAAKAKRARLETELANHRSWNGVIDHFVRHHGLAESRLRALHAYMIDTTQSYLDELTMMDDLIREVDATLGRMRAEPDLASERYLQWAAGHSLFAELSRENEENLRRLVELVRRSPPAASAPAIAAAHEDHWAGQLTFDELVEMYHRDRADHPGHWQN